MQRAFRTRVSRRQIMLLGSGAIGSILVSPLIAACQSSPTPSAPANPTSKPESPTAPAAGQAATTPTAASAQSASPTPAGASKPTGEPITLQLWHDNWGDLYNQLMTKIGDEFTKENPNVTIKWTFNEDNRDKLLTAYAAGTGPDIAEITVWGGECAAFMANGLFMPLDDYWKAAGITPDKFVPAFGKLSQYKGKTLLQPGGADYLAIWFSRDLYKTVGLGDGPKTWDELADQAAQITKKDGSGNIQQFGWNPGNLDRLALSFGGSWMNEDNTQVTANREENIRAAEWLAKVAQTVDATKVRAFASAQPGGSQAGNPFATGKQGMIWSGFWVYESMNKYAPDIDYGVVPQPTVSGAADEQKNYPISGWGWGVSAPGKNPDAAWEATKFAMYDRAAQMGADTVNWPTVIDSWPEFRDRVLKNLPENDRYRPFHGVFEDGYRVGEKFFPITIISPKYGDEIARVSDEIVLGKAAPKEALDNLQKMMEAELAKNPG